MTTAPESTVSSIAAASVRADPYAAGPTLVFKLQISETTGERVHAIALRVQLRIEPQEITLTDDDLRHTERGLGITMRVVLNPASFLALASLQSVAAHRRGRT